MRAEEVLAADRLIRMLSPREDVADETSLRTEVLGGITTFITMSYVVPANAVILHDAGMSFGGAAAATILVAGIFSILAGLAARLPYAIAPYMGENAFFAYNMTMIIAMIGYTGEPWRAALGIVFWSGLVFLLISSTGLGGRVLSSIPRFMIATWASAIGFYIMYVGFRFAHFIPGLYGGETYLEHIVALLIAAVGTALTIALVIRETPGHMLIGFMFTFLLGLAARSMGLLGGERYVLSLHPASISMIAFKADILTPLTHPVLIALIYMLFLIDMIDTMGTAASLSFIARLMDEKGRPYRFDKLLQVDSLSSITASLLGSPTSGVYIESAAGIAVGARTGLSSIVTGLCFLALLPLLHIAPTIDVALLRLSVAPAMIAIGLLFATSLGNIDFSNWAEASTAILTIASMIYTGNLAIGFAAGMITYPLALIASGRKEEVNSTSLLMLLFGTLLVAFLPLRLK